MPRRMKLWIVLWTPVAWLVLELVKYPKNIPLSSGLAAISRASSRRRSATTRRCCPCSSPIAVVAWGGKLFFGRAPREPIP